MTDGHHFNNILLGGRGGTNPGQFKVYSGGLAWKRQGGGKTIEIDKADDVSSLTNFIQKNMGVTPDEKQLSVSGHNWGGIDIDGNMLTFMVGSKQAFEVSLADVAQTQMQGKTDVLLELHVDDTTGANEKDSLMDLSFHVPTSNTQFVGDENRPPAHILWETILKFADVGSSEEPVVTFDGIAILTPRGRYSVELHLSFLRLQGQANDFKIQYSSIVRLFLLPKSNNPHTFVVITLDPPIRKGQTLYPHIVIQFETEAVVERDLALSKELLVDKYKDRLEESYKGLIHEVFTKVLRGLSGAKVTRPGSFRSCQDGYAVKSSLKAEDGLLYPLEKGFFFLPKPPTLILHEEIEFVEFERHGAGGASISSHYFDLLVKLKNDQEHLFRNIQRNEYHNLFNFINGKNIKIMNLGGDGQGASGVVTDVLRDTDDDAVDPHLERIKNQAGDDERHEKKKAKKKKDPNAPKRAMTPFMYFSMAERGNMKSSNPDLPTTEIAKKLGEMWQKMSSEEKQPYIQQAQVDKKRYEKESAVYRGEATADVDSGNESD
ncbi:unnamed protein product [Miscanthus lutarioriparius]|uniref:FACT complex subunit SSRP1 n=1 Tax=Miscanthus lutarioriparius TaxID=422564 RepID=A0A811P3Z4_9POAL|nr:unnamed protein product [Miscanthus lutarioriparius]